MNRKVMMLKGLIIFSTSVFIACFSFLSIIFAQSPDIIISVNTAWESGEYTYNNILVTNGAKLILNGKVAINAVTLNIDSGSSISADGKGYLPGQGPGAGTTKLWCGGDGGSYGGKGGLGVGQNIGGPTYGSAKLPVDLGSGGTSGFIGYGGSGGGAIKLVVSEALVVEGIISANGQDAPDNQNLGQGGGGSGGSVYIITKNFSGAGVITANGGKGGPAGNGYGGGGGGGRIAIYYQTSNFTGMAEVKGGLGNGNNSGSPGTSGFFDVTNNYFYSGHAWVFQENDNPFEFNKIFLKGSSVTSEGAVNISTNDLSLENSNILVSGKETFNIDNLSLINSTIDSFPQARIDFNLKKFNLDVNSYILVDGKGYLAKFGLGAGKTSTWGGSGGGYGGKGGFGGIPKVEGGEIYGKDIMPFDFGSGGSGALSPGGAGAGGGAIKLTVSDTATVNGVISADGMDARQGMYYQDGGGSGGSIYLIAKNLSGTGLIKANGGKSGPDKGAAAGGGGGGGRVAVYYQISDFSGKVEAKGGIGAGCNGENGTVVIQAPSPDAALTFFTLVEKSFTESTLSALWTVQTVNLNSAAVRGDLKGAVNFTAFETITIADGVFSGKGFSKSEFTAVLEGVSYRGACNAVVYFIPWEKKIYLKGEISGEINGVCEGFLTESNPGNGIYDKYQAVWKINRLGAEVVTVAVNLEGLLSYLSAHDFVSEFYLYQADMEGAAFGYYAGSLSAVITHLRLTGDNEYKGQGFSIISYNSSLGQGEGYSYNKLVSEVKVDFYGLFEAPIFGKFSAILEESKLPKNLTGIIERLDSGAIPKSDLKVKAWSPARVSPGETITYVIEYRNDGLKAADNVFIFCYLNTFEKYVRASAGANYSPYSHRLSWKIPALAAKSSGFFTLQTEIAWGLPAHLLLNTHVFITNVGE